MAQRKGSADATEIATSEDGQPQDSATAERAKVAEGMRPVFSEIARLSATLSIARKACYDGDAVKAVRALGLLGKQLPLALETAELIAPSE